MIHKLASEGMVTIRPGVFLWTRDGIINEQTYWHEEDTARKFDFTTYPFWITDDSGMVPHGVESVSDGILTIYGRETLFQFLGA
jgi:hypothetical protein